MASNPRVFISYSHDSPQHSDLVLRFAQELRRNGIDVKLDQFHNEEIIDWPRWCRQQMKRENTDFILCVCTSEYQRRIEGNLPPEKGKGVHWEGSLLDDEIYDGKGNRRVIPILFHEEQDTVIPDFLRGWTHCRVNTFGLKDGGFERLIRILTQQVQVEKNPLGTIPKLPTKSADDGIPTKSDSTEAPGKRIGWTIGASVATAIAIVVTVLCYSVQLVSTWSLSTLGYTTVIATIACLVFFVGGFLFGRTSRWIAGSLFGLGQAALVLALYIVFGWPATITWSVQDVPYPKTIEAGSPLETIKDQLTPPGFPGNEFFETQLLENCPEQASYPQRFVVYVSSEFTKNRFPTEIRAINDQELAIAGFTFHREPLGGNVWKKLGQFGFDRVSGSPNLDIPAHASAKMIMVIVLFPLTSERARDLSDFGQHVTVR